MTKTRVLWVNGNLTNSIASARMRSIGLAVQNNKENANMQFCPVTSHFLNWRRPERWDVIVVNKTHKKIVRDFLEAAQAAGVPAIFDLCDNLFVFPRPHYEAEREKIAKTLQCVTLVTTPTNELKQQLLEAFTISDDKIVVIPDFAWTMDYETVTEALPVVSRLDILFARLLLFLRSFSTSLNSFSPKQIINNLRRKLKVSIKAVLTRVRKSGLI